jgi:hypothetical protein
MAATMHVPGGTQEWIRYLHILKILSSQGTHTRGTNFLVCT